MRWGSFFPLAAAAARAGCGLAGLAGAALALRKGGRAGRELLAGLPSAGRRGPPGPALRGGPDFFGGSTRCFLLTMMGHSHIRKAVKMTNSAAPSPVRGGGPQLPADAARLIGCMA